MSNQERIKEYLVGKKGYLRNDLSNGKVIMLSGKWGSGKTHFWQNQIASDILKKELKDKREVYTYVSLYGKSSIEEIENDIFSQAYSSAIGGENFITKGFATFTKRMKRFGSSKIANGLKDEQKDNIERTALSRLNNGGIICFDDFERKSKDIDLNDLFGFITQLTLNFQCKVVIILNDDVFESEEKAIFSNVKEKTVSKFLKYEPSIEELFNSVFDNELRYQKVVEHREIILETIKMTKELNARIYMQVLNNLCEWKVHNNKIDSSEIKYFIFININFILYHTIPSIIELRKYDVPKNYDLIPISSVFDNIILTRLKSGLRPEEYINRIIEGISSNTSIISSKYYEEIIKSNLNIFKSIFFMNNFITPVKNVVNLDKKNKINNFIETGILIDE